MEKKFNLSRYKELLKLKENGKISFLDSELLDFKAIINEQICYNRKQDYLMLIDEYLNKIISPSEFRTKFLQTEDEDSTRSNMICKNFQELEVFTIAKNLEKFSELRGDISDLCFEFDETWDGTIKPMSESEFYSLVNNYYIQFGNAK